jgi:acetylornithine deacetylase/succinyl-diaminopimelate desuccinylase-like protein
MPDRALAYAKDHKDAFLDEFKTFLRMPSVSTLPEHKSDVVRTAEWVADRLRACKLENVKVMQTAGHPVVYADWLHAKGKPTLLVYGHYDVQPVDPIEEWDAPPFEPAIVGDYIVARGASDMKGQILAQIQAVDALAKSGDLPVNLRYIVEGEEEIGSPNLGAFIDANKALLKCDYVLNCDAGIHKKDVPGIIYGLRGMAYFELEVRSAKKDLHSGLFGGVVHNPAQVLCELIAGMHDHTGRVTLPGFYDKVRPLEGDERAALDRLPINDEDWKEMAGVSRLWGESDYSPVERIGARPTLEVNGFLSGFTGVGSKTVLPAKAMAKISMRLVPDMDPDEVAAQFRAYLKENAPATVTWTVKEMAFAKAAIMNRKGPAIQKAMDALRTVFEVEPVFKREVETVMMGFALSDDGIHGPNERQYLPNYFRGIDTYIRYLASW